jgi:hypothetical protein
MPVLQPSPRLPQSFRYRLTRKHATMKLEGRAI